MEEKYLPTSTVSGFFLASLFFLLIFANVQAAPLAYPSKMAGSSVRAELQVDVGALLRNLSTDSDKPEHLELFQKAIKQAKAKAKQEERDWLSSFVHYYQEEQALGALSALLATTLDEDDLLEEADAIESALRLALQEQVQAVKSILKERARHFDLKRFKIEEGASLGRLQLSWKQPKGSELSEKQLLHKLIGEGKLEFWRLYTAQEFVRIIEEQAQSSEQESDVAQFLKKLHVKDLREPMQAIGYASVADTAKILASLQRYQQAKLLPSDMDFYWSAQLVDGEYKLYAIRTEGQTEAAIDDRAIETVKAENKGHLQGWVIDLNMKERSAQTWYELTKELSVNREGIAIALDREVYTTPIVFAPIRKGRVQISGGFSKESAERLARVLETGRLPAPIECLNLELE